ncbi:MAG: DNA repair protein RadA [Gemmatimonadota bacterium]|nr:DNA repair protein RadA [Gemmatimonadota bacterium]
MAAKQRSVYRCAECGAEHPKWAGRCDGCGAWNTLVEEIAQQPRKRGGGTGQPSAQPPVRLTDVSPDRTPRISTGLAELDYVLGGGLVPGSLVLIGGEPGVGKSTLLLQAAARLQAAGVTTLYAAGEESVDQVRLRADRIAEDAGGVLVLPEVRVDAIIAQAAQTGARVVVVDSIQTTYTDELDGAPGNVGQVRECAARLMRYAKASGAAALLVGHVTRGGIIAGPKTLEHMVDTVVYFEGDPHSGFRILRAVKNRFGSVDEVGIFEMTSAGLSPVANPSAAFLAGRNADSAGTAVTALIEGTRPVLIEIQALAAKAGFGTPQRVATGLEHKRLAVLLAVLERRGGFPFHDLDVFVNVTGGVRLIEPASDLAVVAALVSSVTDRPLPADAVFLGEVGLGGEIRPVAGTDRRLAEAERQGFRRAYVAARSKVAGRVELIPIAHVTDLGARLAA